MNEVPVEATPERDLRLIYPRRVAVGVDLGQSKDPTSIAVVSQIKPTLPREMEQAVTRAEIAELKLAMPQPEYFLHLLEQAPLGESYPLQAQRLNRILARQSIAEHDPNVWIDYTGVGRAVYDIFKQERVPNIKPVTITFNGDEGPNGRGGYNAPKLALVSRLQALMHTGRLKMSDSVPLARIFRRELSDFQVGYSAVGNARFGAREGAHDDLILAVALAVYGLNAERVATFEPLRI